MRHVHGDTGDSERNAAHRGEGEAVADAARNDDEVILMQMNDVKRLVEAEGLIEKYQYRETWRDEIATMEDITWNGVGYGYPSIIEMFFTSIEQGDD